MRSGFFVGSVLLVLAGQMPPMVVAMGAADLAGAVWTALALRADARGAAA